LLKHFNQFYAEQYNNYKYSQIVADQNHTNEETQARVEMGGYFSHLLRILLEPEYRPFSQPIIY